MCVSPGPWQPPAPLACGAGRQRGTAVVGAARLMWALLRSDGTLAIVCLATGPFVSEGRFDCYVGAQRRAPAILGRAEKKTTGEEGPRSCAFRFFPSGFRRRCVADWT